MADDEAREAGGAGPSDETVDSDTDREDTSRSGRRPRSSNRNRDLTKGSIPKNLWYLGWPQVAEGALSVVDQLADLIWAGRIGFQAIAGLGAAQAYLSTIMMARMGLDSSMRSMIARAVGARKISYANHVLLQALTLTSVLAVIIIALVMWLTDFLLAIMGLSDAVIDQASGYMRVQIVAMMVLSFQRITGGALQASGDSMTPLRAAIVTRVSHLILSPFLIFWMDGISRNGTGRRGRGSVGCGVPGRHHELLRSIQWQDHAWSQPEGVQAGHTADVEHPEAGGTSLRDQHAEGHLAAGGRRHCRPVWRYRHRGICPDSQD